MMCVLVGSAHQQRHKYLVSNTPAAQSLESSFHKASFAKLCDSSKLIGTWIEIPVAPLSGSVTVKSQTATTHICLIFTKKKLERIPRCRQQYRELGGFELDCQLSQSCLVWWHAAALVSNILQHPLSTLAGDRRAPPQAEGA
jgi:hypothetical protein